MTEQEKNKPVNKGLLKAFGDKCKQLFGKPKYTYNNNSRNWIKIETSLLWSEMPDYLYINILGLSYGTGNTNKTINGSFYLKGLSAGLGTNLGTEQIEALVIVEELAVENNSSDTVSIYLCLPEGRYPTNYTVDILANKGGEQVLDIITNIGTSQEPNYQLNFKQISIENFDDASDDSSDDYSDDPFELNRIGYITVLLLQATSFTVIEDQVEEGGHISTTASTSYSPDTSFSKIFESKLARQLSHDLTFLYDWTTSIGSEDDPVSITNGKLIDGTAVKIPIPSFNDTSTLGDTWATKVKVTNGIVTDVDTSGSSLNAATTSSLGGIKLMNGSQTSVGDKIPVQLDSDGQAFIDKNSCAVEISAQSITNAEIDYLFETRITGVTLDKTQLTLLKGAYDTLTATITPTDAVFNAFVWTSSNPQEVFVTPTSTSTASIHVSQLATETGNSPYIITCKTNPEGEIATCEITVTNTVNS